MTAAFDALLGFLGAWFIASIGMILTGQLVSGNKLAKAETALDKISEAYQREKEYADKRRVGDQIAVEVMKAMKSAAEQKAGG
jgi:hypothetical protein